ncbi:MAG: CRISPR-associated endoribonuclease Cas6 [Calditrichia bacterium]|nr:CRISPR-associated endoribonuclease Cas6 [Calditrichia bacterium]
MRLKFVLKSKSLPLKIPINYQHFLLRNLLEYYDPIKDRLNIKNEIANNEKTLDFFKYICFSHLHLFKPHFKSGCLVSSKDIVWFYVSSPLDSLIAHLLTLNLVGKNFHVGDSDFVVDKIQLINPPQFKRKLIGEALSPISLSIFLEERHSPTYLNWNDSYWGYHIKKNLIRKYELLYDKKPGDTYLEFNWDFSRGEPKSRLITLEKMNENEFKVRGWMGKFMLKGSKELLKLAWDWGLGEKNYLGFGMWNNVVEHKPKWQQHEHKVLIKATENETIEF